MGRFFLTLFFLIHALFATGQYSEESLTQSLNDVKTITNSNTSLWDMNLYAPILFVDPQTREIFASESDNEQLLMPSETLYVGTMPKSINIANTAIDWGGKRWAMIMLPLPENRNERLQLITHELFHQAQPQLQFKLHNPSNNHLDKKEARIYLRLELEALRAAMLSKSAAQSKTHVTHALTFRQARNQLYPKSDSTEQLLELNEGLAEFTGMMMSDRSEDQIKAYLNSSLDAFLNNKTYVRSFAYQIVPMYGYLLSKINRSWQKEITPESNLTAYYQKAFEIRLPNEALPSAQAIIDQYQGGKIKAEELKRERENKAMVDKQIEKFIKQPHFDLVFENMNVSFNPTHVISLDKHGTVYPTIRVTDNWGILKVEDGALMAPNWNKITITPPTETNGDTIKGKGWFLELKASYTIQQNPDTGNYLLSKI